MAAGPAGNTRLSRPLLRSRRSRQVHRRELRDPRAGRARQPRVLRPVRGRPAHQDHLQLQSRGESSRGAVREHGRARRQSRPRSSHLLHRRPRRAGAATSRNFRAARRWLRQRGNARGGLQELSSKSRRKRQKEFLDEARAASPFTNYLTDYTPSLNLSAIHRGC